MRRAILAATLTLGLVISSADAWAFCVNGDSQECIQPFANGGSTSQQDGITTQPGFGAQAGDQWSTPSHKMGAFTFYGGVSSGSGWEGYNPYIGNGFNTPGSNLQGQPSGANCALYGTCR